MATSVEYLKHRAVRTALERPAQFVRRLAAWPKLLLHPGLRDVHEEQAYLNAVLVRRLRADSNCVDVGAHLGSALSTMVRLAPRGRHVAIEAVQRKVSWLRGKFPEVEVHRAALGAAPGSASFFENTRRSAYSGLRLHKSDGARVRESRIDVARLDDLVERGRRVHFLKIDVEGAELEVLRGSARVLGHDRPLIVFECTASGLYAFSITSDDVHDHLRLAGYSIYVAKDLVRGAAPLDRASFQSSLVYPFRAFNFVALPSESAGAIAYS